MKKSSSKYSNVFSEIVKQIKRNKILFSCNQCHSFLFSSSNISSIYILKEKYFCYVLSNIDSFDFIKVSKEQKMEDTFLKINDTLYSEATCKCGEVIGNKIIMANIENNFLCNSILVRNDKVITYMIKDYSIVQQKIKINYDKIPKCEEEKISNRINEKMESAFDSLNKKMKYVTRGKELLDDTHEIKENIEKLEKIYDYLKYSATKIKP